MFKRNNSLQCKSKAQLSHITRRGLSLRVSSVRGRIKPQRLVCLISSEI